MSGERVAVVGAGIVGLAYAVGAVERGHQVTVFERDARASGASIRNFGMLWPIGQALTPAYATALRSRAVWSRLAEQAGVWLSARGSLHLAHADDEWRVLEEFHAAATAAGIECRLLEAEEVLARSPVANPVGLRGGLWSDTEAGVDPRRAVAAIAAFLGGRPGVAFEFGTAVTGVKPGAVTTADGRVHGCDRIVVCGGSDVETLLPGLLAREGVRRCKLQMLATPPALLPRGLGPFVAGGLTLRHYGNFAGCPGLDRVRRRVADEAAELDRYGIHVMIAETEDGRLVLGDSHEYDAAIEPFDKQCIDDLILRELRRIAVLPEWTIAERWHGIYGKHPSLPIVRVEHEPGVFVRVGTGGAGMTMAFGFAEEDWDDWSRG